MGWATEKDKVINLQGQERKMLRWLEIDESGEVRVRDRGRWRKLVPWFWVQR